jgi:Bacterial transcriptional activator domain
VSCLPPGKASLARVATLQYDGEDDRKAAIQRVRQNKSNSQKVWAGLIGAHDAKRLLALDGGVLSIAADLVRLDTHTFLGAIYDANRARQEERLDDAISGYRYARSLYAGPLLVGRDEEFEWLTMPIEGNLTLREAYRHQERVATERLAELLVAMGRPAEAAPLYGELMRDPGPPDVEAVELEQFVFRQYAFREECARALFECCRLTGDVPALTRAYQELREVLHALAFDADVPVGSE